VGRLLRVFRRVGFTLGGSLWISLPLWVLELYAAVGLGLFAFSLWNLDWQVIPERVQRTDLRVGVLIPTYNEPMEVLLPTVAAAVALEPKHETYVLDDGQRLWVHAMAVSLSARYIAREERTHAKAGNLNHALAQLDLDVIGVLDADHIADAGFLTHILGYFEDPRVAVVQTPQDFYNLDSFEHDKNRSWFWRGRRSISFNEQRLFYRAIQPGKNRWKAVFWCGTNAVVIFSGTTPIHAPFAVFVIAFGVMFALQRLAMALLSRGYAPQGMATLFEFVRLQSNIKATLTYFHRGERPFRVTAKHGTDERRRIKAPWSLWILLGLSGVALAWFACTVAGLTPITYKIVWTAYGALFWGLVNIGFLVGALSRIRSDRFASERRTAVRLQTGGPASIEGRPGHREHPPKAEPGDQDRKDGGIVDLLNEYGLATERFTYFDSLPLLLTLVRHPRT
jgi:glycosyltransferase involved in cell wall biosynthesis